MENETTEYQPEYLAPKDYSSIDVWALTTRGTVIRVADAYWSTIRYSWIDPKTEHTFGELGLMFGCWKPLDRGAVSMGEIYKIMTSPGALGPALD